MRAEVEVFVRLKDGMLDPQGETLAHALASMGYGGVSGMRVGKWITFEIEGDDRESIASEVDETCRRLLANPVIETYRYEIREAGSAPDEGAASGAPAADGSPA